MARSVVSEIEKEFGEPFWSVVEGFARDGYSKSATAMFLGYNTASCFLRKLDRYRPDIEFVKGPDSVCFKEARKDQKGKFTEGMRAAMKRNLDARTDLIRIDYKGITDLISGHAKRAGISYTTAYFRYKNKPEDLDYVFFSGKYPSRKSY